MKVKVVTSNPSVWDLNISEIWSYRYMLYSLIRRDIVTQYKQTILGPVWIILQPTILGLLFSVIFGRIAGLGTDGVPQFLFYFSNNVFWGFVANNFTQNSNVFISNKGLMGKVYFPRLIMPLATLGSSIFKLIIQIVLIAIVSIYYVYHGSNLSASWALLLLPIAILQLSAAAIGVGTIFASVTLKYKDLALLSSIITQAWMYLSPVAYPLAEVPQQLQKWMSLNPISGAMELTRYALYGASKPPASMIIVSGCSAVCVFLIGIGLFNKTQRKFIDIV